jgi:hypothetical protein
MADKRGKCLITVYAEVPAEIEDEYNRWYNTHHIPERLKVPGFLGAVRYEAYFGEPKYLTVYELAHAGVLKDPQLKKLTDNPTEWDRRIMPQIKAETTIWDRIFEYKEPPERHASRAITVRIDPPEEVDAEFNEWYNTHHVPELIGVPGMYCARRFRKRWGDGAKYLAFYEYDDESIQTTDAWKTAGSTDWTKRVIAKIPTPPKLARHRRIFAGYAA